MPVCRPHWTWIPPTLDETALLAGDARDTEAALATLATLNSPVHVDDSLLPAWPRLLDAVVRFAPADCLLLAEGRMRRDLLDGQGELEFLAPARRQPPAPVRCGRQRRIPVAGACPPVAHPRASACAPLLPRLAGRTHCSAARGRLDGQTFPARPYRHHLRL